MDLKNKTIISLIWSLLQQVGSKGAGIIITIILARILTPADFGLIGMLAVFIAISEALVQGGFNQALIQKKDADEEDYSSVFYINLVVSIFLYGLLYISAPYIAQFYNQPILTDLTRVLSLVFVINAFSYVQEARLRKELRFKSLMFIHVPSTIFSGIVAIGMAYYGYGVWSIVGQQISMQLFYAVQLWIYARWRPRWTYNGTRVRSLFSFGGRLMIATIINTFYHNVYLIIIGKLFPVSTLGHYSMGRDLSRKPTNAISFAIKDVTFPAFSLIQEDNEKLRKGYKLATQQLFYIIGPMMIFAGILAVPLFSVVLTDKWLPAVPFFQILCVMGITVPISSFNTDIINVKGRSDVYLKLTIAKKVLDTIGIIVAIPYGIWALVWFQALVAVFKTGLNCYFSGYYIDYSLKRQYKEIFHPILVLTLGVGLILYGFMWISTGWADILQLIIGGTLALTLYWGFSAMVGIEAYANFKNILFSQKMRLNSKSS